MHKPFLIIAALLGALSVMLGAFAAHGLKQIVNDESITIFETGVRYQFYHVFALLILAILYKDFPNKSLKNSGYLFLAGILFFSGSLYFLALSNGKFPDSFTWMYIVTPLGGVCFIAGWLMLAFSLLKKN